MQTGGRTTNRFWEENKKLVYGCGAAVLGLIALKLAVLDTLGRGRRKLEDETAKLAAELEKYHPPGGRPISARKSSFERKSEQLEERLGEITRDLEMPFPEWTTVPEGKEPGSYFLATHATKRADLAALCSRKKVDLHDPNIGFPPEKFGGVLEKGQAGTNLRKLHIVERLVDLLTSAAVKKIIAVRPDEPKKEGAVRYERNPKYDPRNANSQEFIVHPYPAFIWEYPIEIKTVCGIDALMSFLHSVRQRKQFLTIRAIDVDSPDAYEAAGEKAAAWKESDPGLLQVTISAAGMSFISDEDRKAELDKFERKRAPSTRPGTPLGSSYGKPLGI